MYSEIKKLINLLDGEGIPYELTKEFNGYHIVYPNSEERRCSVICHDYSYGHEAGLLEIMGLLTEEETWYDSVVGWLEAEDVFNRIHNDYFKMNK